MTQSKLVEVTCPKCQNEQEVQVYDALNVTLNPAEKATLFEGQINVFECEVCGHKALLAVPFLYHDLERAFCVYYFPAEFVEDDEFIRDWVTAEGKIRVPQLSGGQFPAYMADAHIVFSMQELLNYVVFRERVIDFNRLEPE
jgi:ribosomal protein S27E